MLPSPPSLQCPSPSARSLWEDYLLCLECLEEKQAHIVGQVVPKIELLVLKAEEEERQTSEFTPGFPWILVLFRRLFKHQVRRTILPSRDH